MEKKFTLMKTLTAFLHLLFPSSRKNSRAVRNDQTPGSSTATTTKDKSIDMNDAKDYGASFLFFNQADSQQSGADSPQSTDHGEESKSKEESKRINDELALGNAKPVYRNWRDRVNDDLAACSPIVNPESVVEARESVTVISDLKNILRIITINDKTRTIKMMRGYPSHHFVFRTYSKASVSSFIK